MPILSQQKQSQNTDFPNVRPSLDLRFALAKKLDPRITFTRGSTGTYFGPDCLMKTAGVNEPRFDHDPITGQSLGLLIEESRQNLLTYSDDFGTGWFKGDGSVSTNIITAPDGTTNADAFIENTLTNKFHYINLTLSKSASSIQYTGSIWIKDKGRQVLMNLQSGGSNGVGCRFQPATGQMVVSPVAFGTGWTAGSFSVVPYPNGWYRVSMTATSDTLTTVVFQLATYNTAISSNVYTGDGTSGIYIWGAQLEAGAFPTSYIPTDSTPGGKIRNPDLASMEGTNFSSWYNQNEGSIFMSLVPNYSNAVANRFRRYLAISAGSGQQDNIIQLISIDSSNQIQSAVWYGSVFQAGANLTVPSGNPGKIAYALKQNSAILAGNGRLLQNDASCILPSIMNRMDIGGYVNSSSYQSTLTISRLTYYPIALTPTQLVNITA